MVLFIGTLVVVIASLLVWYVASERRTRAIEERIKQRRLEREAKERSDAHCCNASRNREMRDVRERNQMVADHIASFRTHTQAPTERVPPKPAPRVLPVRQTETRVVSPSRAQDAITTA